MLFLLDSVLKPEEVRSVRQILDSASFVDGKLTAGYASARVKDNSELNRQSRSYELLNKLVLPRLIKHPTYRWAAMPLRLGSPLYAKYEAGQHYGDHVDDPIMGVEGGYYRSDVSITLFFSAPDEYEGGELVIQTPFGEERVKLNAGDAVMYPSSSLHHVSDVTRGQRLVAVLWLQSAIRDPAQRELVYEMYQALTELLKEHPSLEATAKLSRIYANLVRMWTEI